MNENAHQSHGAIVKRLKKANGHMLKVIPMVEDGEPCADVARQLQAVFKAVLNAEQTLCRAEILMG